MKKNHLFGMFAMAAFAFASCSQDEVVTQSPQVNKAIEFGTYVGRDAVSRGSVHTLGTLADNENLGFGVFAYYTDEGDYVAATTEAAGEVTGTTASPCNFMYNQQVKGTSTTTGTGEDAVTTYSWTYSPVKYWPNDPGDKLTFFAYAPYDDADKEGDADNISFSQHTTTSGEEGSQTTTVMAGDPIITFKVNKTVKNQTDLLISKTDNRNMRKNTGIEVDEKVNFQFAHALSRIGFTVKAIVDEVTAPESNANLLDANTTIVVKEVRLVGASGTGNEAPATPIFHSQGTVNLNQQGVNPTTGTYTQVAWTVSQNDTKQYFTLGNANFEPQTDFAAIYDEVGFVINNANSTAPNKLNTDDSYIMIIPQNFVGSGFVVYVDYDVITMDTNIGNDGNTYDGLKSKVTNHISTPIEIDFQSGKAYKLNLQLGMTSVKVTADVDPWVDAADSNVDLPQNTPTPTPATPTPENGTNGEGGTSN